MRQQAPPKRVQFTKKVTSKTTVTTDIPRKSCLKQPSGGNSFKKQLFAQHERDAKGYRQLSVSPGQEEDELALREQNHQIRALQKMQLGRCGKGKAQRQDECDVLPILPEGEQLRQNQISPQRSTSPTGRREPPDACMDFRRYRQFLDNYAPYAGDWAGDVPPTPPCSPIEDYGQDLIYNDEVEAMPVRCVQAKREPAETQWPMPIEYYGPPCPMEELLDDPAFYPLAGSMVEGGLMDLMPRLDLPEPLQPTPYEGIGPSHHGFCQPQSTARHKMVGWQQEPPQVHLYRPDLPPSAPYEPWAPEYVAADDCDLINLMSPPVPSPTELKRLRYTPPPASPPHHPYVGMLGEDPWSIPETMPWPSPRQYSPQRLPRHFGQVVYLDDSPDRDMGEARWFYQELTGQATPPHVRQRRPRSIYQATQYRRKEEESPIDVETTPEWRQRMELRAQEELDRQMKKHGVGKYRKEDYFERLRHCYHPLDRAPWAPPMSAGSSTWFDEFNWPSPKSPPPCEPICETPKRAPARRPVGARAPSAARTSSAARAPPSVCRQGPSGAGSGPPRRRQPPSAPQFKEKLKIDKLPEHLKGKGPTEMKRNTEPDPRESSAKAQRLNAAQERAARAKAYAAQQRAAMKRKC